jgi:hypothetical protein
MPSPYTDQNAYRCEKRPPAIEKRNGQAGGYNSRREHPTDPIIFPG